MTAEEPAAPDAHPPRAAENFTALSPATTMMRSSGREKFGAVRSDASGVGYPFASSHD